MGHPKAPFVFRPAPRRLTGKRCLVSGAGTGIGRAVAIRFGQEGARVGLVGRRAAKIEETAERIREAGAEALVLPCDVSKEEEIAAAVRQVVDTWGGLDALAAVAGIEFYHQGDARVDELELSMWQKIMDVNLTGMFLTCKHAVRAVLAGGNGGSVIVTGSPTGLYGGALGENAYSASKAGCHALARVMAHEYAQEGIRVNIVVPGFIDTAVNDLVFADPEALLGAEQTIPMRRAGHPDEVAGIYAWLASDDASYTTGAYFTVDGGQTAI